MSMKSMTIRPPRSRSRSWRPISSAAPGWCAGGFLDVGAAGAAPEFTSTGTSASVWSMTIAPPDAVHGAANRGLDLVSIWKRWNSGTSSRRTLDAWHRYRHDVAHEVLRLFIALVGVDQDLADVAAEVVADRADEARLLSRSGKGAGVASPAGSRPTGAAGVHVPLHLGRLRPLPAVRAIRPCPSGISSRPAGLQLLTAVRRPRCGG